MKETISLLLPILFPAVMGIVLLCMKSPNRRRTVLVYTGAGLIITTLLIIAAFFTEEKIVVLFYLTETLPVILKLDALGKLFLGVVSIVWTAAGFFSFSYMQHEKNEKRYYGFYLLTYGVLAGLGCSGNLVTMYAFFELMTIAAFPLVIHEQSKEAVMAGLKYLFYSFFGAYMALFGLFFLCRYTNTLTFTPGGTLNMELVTGREGLILLAVCLMLMGFSVKAGMFPLHAWLPTAHPVAPAPASAVLSGIIVKGGILAMLRTVFYLVGADFLRGTWVQYLLLTLSLATVFMGSMLAFREPLWKKRLAYSTVSQLSYIIFGIALLQPVALTGALLHFAAHAFIKSALFLCAGAVICRTGIVSVDGLTGIGKRMPVTIWCYTLVSLALIGIPPTSGFISKWYLAMGALESSASVFRYAGPIVLLISALLTAGYLLPVTIKGFFPGEDFDDTALEKCEKDGYILSALVVLTVLSLGIGMFPNGLLYYISELMSGLM